MSSAAARSSDDEVGDGLHVPAVPGEQVGQHLGASPTQCLDRHPNLPSICHQVARRHAPAHRVDTGRLRFG